MFVDDVAKQLGVSRRTVYNYIARGWLVQVGPTRRITRESVEAVALVKEVSGLPRRGLSK